MKKLLCAILAGVMIFGLAACGEKTEKMPDFSEDALTEAQQYVKAAMEKYEIPDKEEEFKEAHVMLTDDLAKDLAGKVDIEKWDVSEIAAMVVVYLGDKEEGADDSSSSKSNKTAAADTAAAAGEGEEADKPTNDWTPVVFLLDAEKEVLYCKSMKGMAVAEELFSDSGSSSEASDVADAKKALAQALLDKENFVAKNAEALADFPAYVDAKIKENPDYVYSTDFLMESTDITRGQYINLCIKEYNAQKWLTDATAENPKSSNLLEKDQELLEQKHSLLRELVGVNVQISNMDATQAEQLAAYKAVLDSVKGQEKYLFDETYVRAALADNTANKYDTLLRQQWIYQTSIDAIDRAMVSLDTKERNYILERSSLETGGMSDYSNAYKTYVQCLLNLDNFNALNAEAMAAYEAEVAAVKDAVGDNYKDSVEYMKVELKYGDMLKSRDGYKNAIPLAKADLDAMGAEIKEDLDEVDADEQERLDEIVISKETTAFFEYASKATADVTEYEAAKGQLGTVHPDYAAYQNEHLKYYTSSSSGSGSSYSSGSSSGSSSGNKGSGGYDMPNEGESFSDYMKRVDPELYDSITDRYDAITGN